MPHAGTYRGTVRTITTATADMFQLLLDHTVISDGNFGSLGPTAVPKVRHGLSGWTERETHGKRPGTAAKELGWGAWGK